MMLLVLLSVGLVAGVLAGIFGIGGGIVIVPALIFFARMTPQTAIGTSLGALLLPVGVLGVWQYWQRGNVQVNASLLLALGVVVGSFFGARIGLAISPRLLQRGFSVLLVLVAVRLWMKS